MSIFLPLRLDDSRPLATLVERPLLEYVLVGLDSVDKQVRLLLCSHAAGYAITPTISSITE